MSEKEIEPNALLQNLESMLKVLEDHEKRIRKLEGVANQHEVVTS